MIEGSDTLTWDGNTEGLVYVEDEELCKVSGATPTLEDFKNGFYAQTSYRYDDEGEISESSGPQSAVQHGGDYGDCLLISSVAVIAPFDGASFFGIPLPEKGTYFISEDGMSGYTSLLRIPGYTGF